MTRPDPAVCGFIPLYPDPSPARPDYAFWAFLAILATIFAVVFRL